MVTQHYIIKNPNNIYTVEIFLWLLNIKKGLDWNNLHSRNFLMVTQRVLVDLLLVDLHSRNFLMVTQPLHCYIAQLKSIFSY